MIVSYLRAGCRDIAASNDRRSFFPRGGLLLSALAHYDKLEPMMFRDVAYSQAEGFWMTDMYLHGVIVGQHAKIAVRKGKVEK